MFWKLEQTSLTDLEESEQEQLSVLAALVDYRAAIAPSFLPAGLILASEVLWDWRKEMSQLPSLFACYINHFKNKEKKIRESDLILLAICSCWEKWCFTALSWASLVVKEGWWKRMEGIGETQKAPYYIELLYITSLLPKLHSYLTG